LEERLENLGFSTRSIFCIEYLFILKTMAKKVLLYVIPQASQKIINRK
jgi:hypothetical protein